MRGRRFAAFLIVLSMILMLVPMQAFAGETEETVSGSEAAVSGAVSAGPAAETETGQALPNEQGAGMPDETTAVSETEETEEAEEVTAEEVTEESDAAETVSEETTEAFSAAAAIETDAEAVTEEETEEIEAAEDTEETDAALAEESAGIAQTDLSYVTSGEVTWYDAVSEVNDDGSRTVTFSASIPEGTTEPELYLNVLDTPNLSAINFIPAAAETVKYVVNVTDATGSYSFVQGSGAVALADGTWTVYTEVDESTAAAVLLSADGASGNYNAADTYLSSASSGDGNGFSSVLQSQWSEGQTAQTISYYQQLQSSVSAGVYAPVQFKLEAGQTADSSAAESTGALSGNVPLTVKKVLTGRTLKAEEFSFELKDENGNVLQTKKNELDGKIPFDALHFTENDLGEHKYTINEVMPDGAKADSSGKVIVDNIEYDTHTESVTIIISLNEEGKLKATVRQSTTELTFTNKYAGTGTSANTGSSSTTKSRTSPTTGDRSPIMPYIFMMSGAGLALLLCKRLIRAYVRH